MALVLCFLLVFLAASNKIHSKRGQVSCQSHFEKHDGELMSAFTELEKTLGSDPCFDPDRKGKTVQACLTRSMDKPYIIMLGDSHSSALRYGLKSALGMDVIYVAFGNWVLSKHIHEITEVLPKIIRHGDVVAWTENAIISLSDYEQHVDNIFAAVKSVNSSLLLLGDTPQLPLEPQKCLLGRQFCTIDFDKQSAEREKFDNLIYGKYASEPGVVYYNMFESLCSKQWCNMYVPDTRTIAFADKDHLNQFGSMYVAEKICNFLQDSWDVGA